MVSTSNGNSRRAQSPRTFQQRARVHQHKINISNQVLNSQITCHISKESIDDLLLSGQEGEILEEILIPMKQSAEYSLREGQGTKVRDVDIRVKDWMNWIAQVLVHLNGGVYGGHKRSGTVVDLTCNIFED